MRAKSNGGISTTMSVSAIVVLIIIAAAGWSAYAAFPSGKTVTQTIAGGTVTVSGGGVSTETITASQSGSIQQSPSAGSTTGSVSTYLPSTVSTTSFTILGFTAIASESLWWIGQPPYSNIFKQFVPDATFTSTGAAPTIPTSLIQGQVQMAYLESIAFVATYAQKAPVSLVANLISQPQVWTIVVAANSSIKSMSQLHGKVFAIGAQGSTSQQVTQWELQTQFGWKVNTDYTFSTLGSLAAILGAVQSGAVPATAIGLGGIYGQLLTGQYRTLYNFTVPYPTLSLWASNSFIQQHPDAVRATIVAFLHAGYFWNTNSTAVESMVQNVYKYNPAAAAYIAQTTVISQDGGISLSQNQQAVNLAFESGAVSQNFSITPFVSTQFVPISY